MNHPRGMTTLLFLLVVGGLLFLVGYTVLMHRDQYTNQEDMSDIMDDPQRFKEFLITGQRDEAMAEYSVGIFYTLSNFLGFSGYLASNGESMERICSNGRVNRADPEVQRTVKEILCGPDVPCEGVPYIFRAQADDRCYASATQIVVSANLYAPDGSLQSLCVDPINYFKLDSTANPNTLQCD